jgi:MFS family permease
MTNGRRALLRLGVALAAAGVLLVLIAGPVGLPFSFVGAGLLVGAFGAVLAVASRLGQGQWEKRPWARGRGFATVFLPVVGALGAVLGIVMWSVAAGEGDGGAWIWIAAAALTILASIGPVAITHQKPKGD